MQRQPGETADIFRRRPAVVKKVVSRQQDPRSVPSLAITSSSVPNGLSVSARNRSGCSASSTWVAVTVRSAVCTRILATPCSRSWCRLRPASHGAARGPPLRRREGPAEQPATARNRPRPTQREDGCAQGQPPDRYSAERHCGRPSCCSLVRTASLSGFSSRDFS